ncbi:MAG TPA: hypothetical protein VLX29_09405 [Nitrospirota bacterium]|nr:hypothetical protein [Nitrospirota bacterium]
MRFRVIVGSLVLVLYACAAPKPAPTLNLYYSPTVRAQGNNITILLTRPSYTGSQQLSVSTNKEIGPDDTIPAIYTNDYSVRLQNAIQTDLEKILIAKGFMLARSSDPWSDSTSSDMSKIDFTIFTIIDFGPQVSNYQRVLHFPTGSVVVMNEGTVAFTGSLIIKFVDPLTKKTIIAKTVTMASLDADNPIEYEDLTDAENKATELINKFYPRLLTKIEKSISTDELLAALTDIKTHKDKTQSAP